ncbi:hypothetical protein IWW48_002689 [Coemansia sp. RSA 1200]|nr:hypothetical protein IWW48_002689 [Coemansia sp. RSA 1200]
MSVGTSVYITLISENMSSWHYSSAMTSDVQISGASRNFGAGNSTDIGSSSGSTGGIGASSDASGRQMQNEMHQLQLLRDTRGPDSEGQGEIRQRCQWQRQRRRQRHQTERVAYRMERKENPPQQPLHRKLQ